MKNTNLETFEVATLSPEAMKLINDYLRESLLTDGKRPLNPDENMTLLRFLSFFEKTMDTRKKYESCGLD
jgi:hypothetical protein